MAEDKPTVGSYRCLIAEDETIVGMGVATMLEKLGHQVVGQAASAAEAQALFRQHLPDLVLMDIRLAGDDGIELTKKLLKIRPCPVIIASAYSDKELIDRATASGVFGYLIKPITQNALAAQIEVAVKRFHEYEQMVQTLETRKLVEKAKGIVMKRLSLSEPEAHKRLQQESQKRRQSLAELSRKIIESEEMLGGTI